MELKPAESEMKPSASNPRFKVAKVGFAPFPDEESKDYQNGSNAVDPESVRMTIGDDENENMNHPDNFASMEKEQLTYTDTANVKTFGHNTHEALPHDDHYRNLFSATHALRMRPTLEELHGEQEYPFYGSGDIENGTSSKENIVVPETAVNSGTTVKFGWIKGVLIRCLLNIWGVMLFIRLSWVVGQAGIGLTFVIILLSALVTTITAISMSAICTNGQVKGGGAYFMISRSLGPEFGGAIGVIFSLANAVAVSLYVVGCAETVRDVMYEHGAKMVDELNDVRIIGALALLLTGLIAVVGMEWEARAQIGLLVILLVALADFFVGTFIPPTEEKQAKGFFSWKSSLFVENLGPSFTLGEGFFTVFAVFFLAATGILAGANISGDLEDAQNAIPKGTLLAILITTITYLLVALACSFCAVRHAAGVVVSAALANLSATTTMTAPVTAVNDVVFSSTNGALTDGVTSAPDSFDFLAQIQANNNACIADSSCQYGLLNSYQMMEMMAGFGPIITAGIFSATLSSALASLVSAPKVFQAVCNDRIFPWIHVFAKGYGKNNEPLRAYALTFIIALAFIAIGDLNIIALFISNFFLMAYALINYSCFDASLAKSPGWRPSFRYYSMWISLFGSLLCLGVMFVIMWWIALCTFLLVAVLYIYVHYSKPDVNWGSSAQAHVYRNALQSSLKLVQVSDHIKNYRPQILILCGFPSHRPALIDFAHTITKKQSLLACGHVLVTDRPTGMRQSASYANKAYEFLAKRKTKAFYNVICAPSFRYGAQSLMQSVGVGKLRPNTLIMGYKSDWQKVEPDQFQEYINVIHDAFDLRFGVGILRIPEGFCKDVTEHESHDEGVGNEYEEGVQDDDEELGSGSDDSSEEENEPYPEKAEKRNPDVVHLGDNGEEAVPLQHVGSKLALAANGNGKAKKLKGYTRFSRKQRKGTIDVYWLFDDGGLTILLPYILSTKSLWRNSKLRVFSPGTKKHQLDNDQRHMATLLSKFRIDYSSVTILPDVGKKPRKESWENFNKILDKWLLNESEGETLETHPWKISSADLRTLKAKTNRQLRLKELLMENSAEASLIVMTLPMPRKNTVPASLYMAWIETLTSDLPPILLLRGNQQSVLTYYS